jgi:predicted amidohydrolase YtcJ
MLQIILRGDRWERGLRKSVEYLHNNGITTVADMLAIDGFNPEQVRQFHEIIDAEDVPLRTYMVAEPRVAFEKSGADAAVAYIDSLPKKDGVNLKYLRAAKGFVDGAFFAQLMRMKGGYTDGHQGEWITPPEELKEIVTVFWNKGYPLHIHVNGDEGLDSILLTFSELKKKNPQSVSRVTFHHMGYARPDQIKKMKDLGICASILPYYLRALGDVYSTHGFGVERASHISSAATYLKNGIIVSLHSDFCMAPSNPLFSAWISVNRIGQISGKVLGPEERISVYDALRAITIDAAYTFGLENEIGSISAGKKADFTILAEDPLKTAPFRLKDIKIVAKVFNGRYYRLNNT